MGHFIYPVGWVDPLPPVWVPDTVEYKLLWDQTYKSINGDDGGTWAPTLIITIGGAGVSLAGVNHEVPSGGALNVRSGGQVLAEPGGLIRLDGTGTANIDLYVTGGGVPLIDVASGGAIRVFSGGALDVFGSLTFKDASGPGTATWEANATALFSSGSTLTIASGATQNVVGDLKVLNGGVLTISATGTGSFVAEDGATFQHKGTVSYFSTAVQSYSLGAKSVGIHIREAREVRSGASARTVRRPSVTLPNANANCSIEEDSYDVPLIITASRTYTVLDTGLYTPTIGESIRFSRFGTSTPSGVFVVNIVRETGSLILFTFYAGRQGFCVVEYKATGWELVAGNQAPTGAQSGFYNDVW